MAATDCTHPGCGRRYEHLHCQVCDQAYTYKEPDEGEQPPATCGFVQCSARHGWSADEWAGRARMAAARRDAGRISHRGPLDEDGNRPTMWGDDPLDDLDREALRRAEGQEPAA